MNKGAVLRRRLLGVGFIVLIVALVALSIALYNKVFTPVVSVKLQTAVERVSASVQSAGVCTFGLLLWRSRSFAQHRRGCCYETRIEWRFRCDLHP